MPSSIRISDSATERFPLHRSHHRSRIKCITSPSGISAALSAPICRAVRICLVRAGGVLVYVLPAPLWCSFRFVSIAVFILIFVVIEEIPIEFIPIDIAKLISNIRFDRDAWIECCWSDSLRWLVSARRDYPLAWSRSSCWSARVASYFSKALFGASQIIAGFGEVATQSLVWSRALSSCLFSRSLRWRCFSLRSSLDNTFIWFASTRTSALFADRFSRSLSRDMLCRRLTIRAFCMLFCPRCLFLPNSRRPALGGSPCYFLLPFGHSINRRIPLQCVPPGDTLLSAAWILTLQDI